MKKRFVVFIVMILFTFGSAQAMDQGRIQHLVSKAQKNGHARVIVRLKLDSFKSESRLKRIERRAQRARILSRQNSFVKNLKGLNAELKGKFKTMPSVVLKVDSDALKKLSSSPLVESIEEDSIYRPLLNNSTTQIHIDTAWDLGFTGAGQTIAILDTGVDINHRCLSSKIVYEECFSSGGDCPDGSSHQVGAGSGRPLIVDGHDVPHGTHVAGIAAGDCTSTWGLFDSGVARDANIMVYQIFHESNSDSECGGEDTAPCPITNTSDIVHALESVHDLQDTFTIASVNMSLGSEKFNKYCNRHESNLTSIINDLTDDGIAVFASSGNDEYDDGICTPACIENVISVGSVGDDGSISDFSNVSPIIDMFAPGDGIVSAIPAGFGIASGTSMASPHAAGAWAVLREAFPDFTENITFEDLKKMFLNRQNIVNGRGVSKPTLDFTYMPFEGCDRLPFLRFYSTDTRDHMYTSVAFDNMIDLLKSEGFRRDGNQGKLVGNEPGTQPLYRLYIPGRYGFDDHFYTINVNEKYDALDMGYEYEGIEGFAYPNQVSGTVPLYRLYHEIIGDHLYTTSSQEVFYAYLMGYTVEGVACYVRPN